MPTETHMGLTEDQKLRYIALLRAECGSPGIDELTRLVRAHVTRVPFENVSKLWYWKTLGLAGLPGIDRYLDGIEKYNFGGTCYANNYYFYLLLVSLGYDARLCGADMSHPDVHVVAMVNAGNREYIVDGGYAAPFFAPLPRDASGDVVIEHGNERYVLSPPDARGASRLSLYRDGVLKHGYTAKPGPRRIEEFEPVIAGSFRPAATFMNAVVVTRFGVDRSIVLHNRTLIESRGTTTSLEEVGDREGVIAAIERHFGIPRAISAQSLPDMERLDDPWA